MTLKHGGARAGLRPAQRLRDTPPMARRVPNSPLVVPPLGWLPELAPLAVPSAGWLTLGLGSFRRDVILRYNSAIFADGR